MSGSWFYWICKHNWHSLQKCSTSWVVFPVFFIWCHNVKTDIIMEETHKRTPRRHDTTLLTNKMELHLITYISMIHIKGNPLSYMKPELDVPINTEWQKTNQAQVCPTRFDHCRDLFRGELLINQAIFGNIYLGTEITCDLCGVFDKTDAQRWNKS